MGLVGVLATQLWHHTYIDPDLADLPSFGTVKYRVPSSNGGPHAALGRVEGVVHCE
jgi:hypothetical protein